MNKPLGIAYATTLFLLLLPATLPAQDYKFTTNNNTIAITGYTGPGGAITIPDTLGGLPVVSIKLYAFRGGAKLTSVTLPITIRSIEYGAFTDCKKLVEVTIPNSVTNIGCSAFGDCGLTNVMIPNSITSIERSVFSACRRLVSITIPNSVTCIEREAFFGCNNLATIKIPDSVTSIGELAFCGCPLGNITIPKGVTNIEQGAFSGCRRLTGVYFQGNAPIGVNVFDSSGHVTVYHLAGTTGWESLFGGRPTAVWDGMVPSELPYAYQPVTQEEFFQASQKRVQDMIAAQRTNVVRQFSKEEEDWVKMVQLTFEPPPAWPEAFHKKETLQHCAAILRSAIDPKEIERDCSQLTNQPEAAVALKNFSQLAISGLDEFATILTIPGITTRGDRVEFSDSQNYYTFTFWFTKRLPSSVRSIEKRLPNTHLVMGGDFYENGKLRVFHVLAPPLDSNGLLQESGFSFTEEGKLDGQWIRPVQETNVIRHITPEDFARMAKQAEAAQAKETNVVRHITKADQEWLDNYAAKHKSHDLPIRATYQIDDDCILVLQNYDKEPLSLTVTAINETSPLTNSCVVTVAGEATKDLNLLKDWILMPDDRVRVEMVSQHYPLSRIWITGCRTPSQKIAAQQDQIYTAFNQPKDEAEKNRSAQTLSGLWRAGLLKDEIKEELTQKYFHLELIWESREDGWPSWIVKAHPTFPFPDVNTKFTITQFLNDQNVGSSDGSSGPMTTAGLSSIGGVRKNGDVLQYKIGFRQTIRGKTWETSLWTNKITLQLKK